MFAKGHVPPVHNCESAQRWSLSRNWSGLSGLRNDETRKSKSRREKERRLHHVAYAACTRGTSARVSSRVYITPGIFLILSLPDDAMRHASCTRAYSRIVVIRRKRRGIDRRRDRGRSVASVIVNAGNDYRISTSRLISHHESSRIC